MSMRFNKPNSKAYEQLELLLLEALAALASNDFADEIEYLKLLTMLVIASSRYYEKAFSCNPVSSPNYTHLAFDA